jgi:NTP pyrophosphatase (non-canonical NTP hydrolase)
MVNRQETVLSFDEYQQRAMENVVPHEGVLQCLTLGLGEEAGEVISVITKLWRYQDITSSSDIPEEELEVVGQELGDVLWYVAALAGHLGVKMSDLPKHNLDKLHYRRSIKSYERWFNREYPDCDPLFSAAYWEKARKVRHSLVKRDGLVFHPLFPNVVRFNADMEFHGIWVKPVDAQLLAFQLKMALGPSQIYDDDQMREYLRQKIVYTSESESK